MGPIRYVSKRKVVVDVVPALRLAQFGKIFQLDKTSIRSIFECLADKTTNSTNCHFSISEILGLIMAMAAWILALLPLAGAAACFQKIPWVGHGNCCIAVLEFMTLV